MPQGDLSVECKLWWNPKHDEVRRRLDSLQHEAFPLIEDPHLRIWVRSFRAGGQSPSPRRLAHFINHLAMDPRIQAQLDGDRQTEPLTWNDAKSDCEVVFSLVKMSQARSDTSQLVLAYPAITAWDESRDILRRKVLGPKSEQHAERPNRSVVLAVAWNDFMNHASEKIVETVAELAGGMSKRGVVAVLWAEGVWPWKAVDAPPGVPTADPTPLLLHWEAPGSLALARAWPAERIRIISQLGRNV